ncbi:signal transduction histidine kinase [Nonomuraea polychroma]|uniref:histidine kinase n=1 Tax=Nonomuraea polychroma TaxID=46176 RepID=A0A438MGL6_9ACTN|nr:histidine kinase [Nonomuraea polychroma]RVX44982.1 signal transduction histidine kinase [Nonomuraea polychroma]
MSRYALVAAVVVADTALLWLDGTGGWALSAYAMAAALTMAAMNRLPFVAFLTALALAVLTGGSLALLICTGFQAGHRISARRDVVVTACALSAYVCVLLLAVERSPGAQEVWITLARVVMLTALPLLAGRYVAQEREHLRRESALIAEQERLRERLRIAHDMHDSLGHLLSLVSVQAAALEVGPLPLDQQRAVGALAGTARAAAAELHEVVNALRSHDAPGLDNIDDLVARSQAAGAMVTIETSGEAVPLTDPKASHAAYRVVQEGLTNAVKHAPGTPITVSLDWQPDALLVSVANPAPRRPSSSVSGGSGLQGLTERIAAAGGLLQVHPGPREFRLVAMLPLVPALAVAAT